ncbi:MAG: protein involved in polysaccharide export with SLBB domain [Candidatus Latescibacterota bacterium]|jgi:protein involved in polysaccharide export with SLBB domain
MMTQMTQPNGLFRRIYIFLITALIFAMVFEPIALHAQSKRNNKTRNKEESTDKRKGSGQPFSQQTLEDRAAQLEEMGVSSVKITSIGRAAYESVIQSGRYIIGPGDVFNVVLGSGESLEATEIVVGVSGDLVIPNIGAIPVATRTLAETQQTIQDAIANKIQHLALTISLSRLRSFPINVHGEVQFPGAYGVNGIEQASELIVRSGGLLEETNKRASLRNIQIRRLRNGQWEPTGQRADLLLWNLTGKEQYNPYILDGDQIFVPTLQDSINISGAVYRPGNYEYAPGDRIAELLTLGGGLKNPPQSPQAQLLRLSPQGKWIPIQIDLVKIQNGDTTSNIALQANDKLYVLGEERWVYVEGEVQFPGTYPIENGLTLRQLLKRTQLKSEASLAQASLIRKVDYKKKVEDEEDVVLTRLLAIPRNQLTDEEEALIALKTQQVSGRLPINFNEIMTNENSPDINLRDGDNIRIPRFISSVRVYGAVQAPANIPYNTTANIQTYIDAAGGFTDRARITDIVLIKGNTETAIKINDFTSSVDPGDAIFIPTKVEIPGQGYRIFREVLAVTGSVASLILTIVAIRR